MLRCRNCTATFAFLQCGRHLYQKLRCQQTKNCTATSKSLRCRKVALSCNAFKPPRLGTHVSDLLSRHPLKFRPSARPVLETPPPSWDVQLKNDPRPFLALRTPPSPRPSRKNKKYPKRPPRKSLNTLATRPGDCYLSGGVTGQKSYDYPPCLNIT